MFNIFLNEFYFIRLLHQHREVYLIKFAEPLLTHFALWQVGFKYLEHCEKFGKIFMEEVSKLRLF